MKKAQGLSMTTIVLAALALLVLVVLTLIFTGRMGNFSLGVEKNTDCQKRLQISQPMACRYTFPGVAEVQGVMTCGLRPVKRKKVPGVIR